MLYYNKIVATSDGLFLDIHQGITNNGYPYQHPEFGWPGRAVDVKGALDANPESKANIGAGELVTAITVAFPAEIPPGSGPRIIQITTRRTEYDTIATQVAVVSKTGGTVRTHPVDKGKQIGGKQRLAVLMIAQAAMKDRGSAPEA